MSEITSGELLAFVGKCYPEELENIKQLLSSSEVAQVAIYLLALGFLTGRQYGLAEASKEECEILPTKPIGGAKT